MYFFIFFLFVDMTAQCLESMLHLQQPLLQVMEDKKILAFLLNLGGFIWQNNMIERGATVLLLKILRRGL